MTSDSENTELDFKKERFYIYPAELPYLNVIPKEHERLSDLRAKIISINVSTYNKPSPHSKSTSTSTSTTLYSRISVVNTSAPNSSNFSNLSQQTKEGRKEVLAALGELEDYHLFVETTSGSLIEALKQTPDFILIYRLYKGGKERMPIFEI